MQTTARRWPWIRAVEGRHVALVAAFVLLVLVVLSVDRGVTPFHDEWWFICGRSLTDVGSLLAPHNEHWVALSAAAYVATADLFGVTSEIPFVILLLAAHAAASVALYRLTASTLATAVFVLFGAGFENLFWGFQIGMVGATALGLWAMVAFNAERPGVGALLLLAGVATAGNALIYIPAIAVLLVASGRWREAVYLIPAAGAYGLWALLERGSINARGGPDTLRGIYTFVKRGLLASLGFGAGSKVAAGTVVLLVAAWPRRVTPLVLAAVTGLVATFVALALTREGFAPADASRYLYVAAPFVLITVAGLGATAKRPLAARGLLVIALVIGAILLISHGLRWPAYVEAGHAAGADRPPPGVCTVHPM
jgi:hypothetical protein